MFRKTLPVIAVFAAWLPVAAGFILSDALAGESKAGSADSSTVIPVVVQAVACAPDLLRCHDLRTDRLVFGDMDACHEALDWVRSRDNWPETYEPTVIMAKCRYSPAVAHQGRAWSRFAGVAVN